MPLYFEIGPSPRRVVELGRRDAVPKTGIDYSPVADELSSEELSVHELTDRLRAARLAIKRKRKGLDRADAESGGPATDRERAKWERQIGQEQARIPQLQALLADAERRLRMLRAVVAGTQFDDRLPPPEQPEPNPGVLPPEPEPATTVDQDEQTGEEAEPRVAAIVRHLEELAIPTDLGRTKVRELIQERDPGYRVGDRHLSRAIAHRRAG